MVKAVKWRSFFSQHQRLMLWGIVLLYLVIALSSCDSGDDGVEECQLEIFNMGPTRTNVYPGEAVEVVANIKSCGASVKYVWSANYGEVPSGQTSQSSISYTAPNFTGEDTITVRMNDTEGRSAFEQATVFIVEPEQDTAIPASGPEIATTAVLTATAVPTLTEELTNVITSTLITTTTISVPSPELEAGAIDTADRVNDFLQNEVPQESAETADEIACDDLINPSGTEMERATRYNNRGVACNSARLYEQALSDFNQADDLEPDDPIIHANRSVTHFFLNDYPAALNDLDFALSKNPAKPLWWAVRGLIRSVIGDCDGALADLNQALELLPDEYWFYIARGLVYEFCGDYAAAQGDYKTVIEDSDEPDERAMAHVGLGQLYDAQEEYDQAIREYGRAINEDETLTMAYTSRGATYLALEQYTNALNDFNQAVNLDPESPNVYKNRGDAYYLLGRYQDALDDYEASIEWTPKVATRDLARLHANMGYAYFRLSNDEESLSSFDQAIDLEPKPTYYLARGVLFSDQEIYYQAAIDDLSIAISRGEDELSLEQLAMAFQERGQIYVELNDQMNAMSDFADALDIDLEDETAHAETYNRRGLARSKWGEYEGADDDFTRAIALNPSMTYYFNRASVREKSGQYEAAVADYTFIISIEPVAWQAYRNRGYSYLYLDQCADAMDDYTAVLQNVATPRANDYYFRAQSYICLQEYAQAIGDYTESLALEPDPDDQAAIYNQRGVAHASLEQHSEAIEDYSQAIELSPSATKYFNRAQEYMSLEQYQEAIQDYTASMEEDPDFIGPYRGRGLAYLKQDMNDEAIDDFTIVLDAEPGDGWTYYYRGIAYMRQELATQARSDLEQAQQIASFESNTQLLEAIDEALAALP